jgi:hypothetical protein
LLPAIDGWQRVDFGTEKRVTVDAGREANANRMDIEFGLKTLTDDYAERGLDFKTEARKRARDIKILMEVSREFGVPFDAQQLYKGMRAVSHPTWFVKKEVYDRVGQFSEVFKIAMDYDLMCRLKKEAYGYMNETIVKFDDGGVSTNQYLKSLQENVKVYESHFGFSIAARAWQFRLSILFYLLQSKFGKFLYAIKAANFK